ncbi:D-aminoacylase [Bordetella genomosp. 8]|uniref:D-aminoacylase n=1 Tax=Bordetella genomosp. 8 TaxID=1416806 RepID=A0A1W6YT91_9BORD|nr:D-aminoacylase [Bordetella genomosp. 8]ARP84231.1 D-aminoacylase [Bordetella genomosp. 8]
MPTYDLILRNGTVIDGSGGQRMVLDVAIHGQRIAALGNFGAGLAAVEIDVSGRVVAPGFIDAHTHDDRYLLCDPGMPAKLSQGVTTVVTGNCGLSLAPWIAPVGSCIPAPMDLLGEAADFSYRSFGAYLDAVDATAPALNAACLVGHSALRLACMASVGRAATEPEIEAMKALLREALESGAIGFSTGLNYPPAAQSTQDELERLAAAARGYGAVYASHIRDESEHIIPALDEACCVGRAADAMLVVSHHKLSGRANHGRSEETQRYLAQAIRRQPVSLDCYPYNAGSSMLRLANIRRASRVIVTRSDPYPDFVGRDLDDIAKTMGWSIEHAVESLQPAGAIYFMMDERDVQRILAFPQTMIGSDGLPHDIAPHPRLWGTFPRVLGHYSRDLGLFSLETAVHKMTGLTALNFGLSDRGLLAPGMFADITVFDPATVADTATWLDPIQPAAGIDMVMVNGTISWRNGSATGARAGKVIRRHTGDA